VRLMPGVERTRNDLLWLRRLENAIRLAGFAALTFSIILGLGVVFIIGNTIRLTLFARREEISIMHLVGASDLFIRTPYVNEGVLCGALGGLIAHLVLAAVFHGFFLPLVNRYSGEDFVILSGGWRLGLALTGIGAALGFVGSWLSVRHFLRERR
ncbi:MAG: FtsX-like permease family protein, partial [bacterium]